MAGPLWELLLWVCQNPPEMEFDHFKNDWEVLVEKIDRLRHVTSEQFNSAAIAEELLTRVMASFQRIGREDLVRPELAVSGTYVRAEAPAVAMFGGLNANLSSSDIVTLRDALVKAAGGVPSKELSALFYSAPLRMKPWQDGYQLADDFLEQLTDEGLAFLSEGFVDVEGICKHLSIKIIRRNLDTETIRGVALAGDHFSPTILINNSVPSNRARAGRRFTIAHELGHILFDQSRARRLAHTSGSWAAPGIEKRANAFAAWLLMPPNLLGNDVATDRDTIKTLASRIKVPDSALVEHLYNLGFIAETERQNLRVVMRGLAIH